MATQKQLQFWMDHSNNLEKQIVDLKKKLEREIGLNDIALKISNYYMTRNEKLQSEIEVLKDKIAGLEQELEEVDEQNAPVTNNEEQITEESNAGDEIIDLILQCGMYPGREI